MRLTTIVHAMVLVLAVLTLPAGAADLTIKLSGAEKIRFVGAFQRWDMDGNPTRLVNPKAKIDQPEVDAAANDTGGGKWVFKNLKPGKYDVVLMGEDRLRIEGWEYAPVLEFDPFLPATATVEDASVREYIVDHIKKSRHYENRVVPLNLGGDSKSVRILMMLIRDQQTSYEGEFPGAATMRFEIWQYDNQYGGWTKNRRTRVMHRVLLDRDELRKWTWLWEPKLGAVEVNSDDVTIDYAVPSRTENATQGLRPYRNRGSSAESVEEPPEFERLCGDLSSAPCVLLRLRLRPTEATADGVAPATAESIPFFGGDTGFELAVEGPVSGDVLDVVPEADGQSGQVGSAQGGGFRNPRSADVDSQQVCLELHQLVVDGGAAVDAEIVQLDAGVALHGGDEINGLIGHRLDGGPGDVRGGGAAGDSEDGAAGV